ncbi:MAG: RNA polymerase sigma factor [Nocardioidaceae bacterium]
MPTFDDAELDARARRAQQGDSAAMDDLLAMVRPLVVARCRRFLPFNDDAEEAAQEALLTISLKLHTWTGDGSVRSWIVAVTSNTARTVYRSLRRRADELGELPPEPADPRTTSVVAGTRVDLLEAISGLEERHPAAVEAFVLRDLGGLPYDEIARLTDASPAKVKDRIHRARVFVREALGPG